MACILIIDDARNIRKMVRLTLQKAGHEITEADDGARGLELFGDGQSFDLTLVDQQMPGVEGLKVVEEARRRDSSARLLMMTAFATPELAGDVLEAGAVDFLAKPFFDRYPTRRRRTGAIAAPTRGRWIRRARQGAGAVAHFAGRQRFRVLERGASFSNSVAGN